MTFIQSFLNALAISAALAAPLAAGSLSFTGSLNHDDDEAMFSFTIGSQETVTLRTWSYAGGINAAGVFVAGGGFDPVLTVFDNSGNWQGANNDGTGIVATDSATGNAFDSFLSVNLPAGHYNLVLTESDNTAIGSFFSDGFTQSGQGNFTCPEYLGVDGAFCDATPAFRTGSYAVDILFADSVAPPGTPEPGTGGAVLVLGAIIGILKHHRDRQRRQEQEP